MMPVTIEWILIFLFMVIILVLFVAYSRLRGEIERRALKLFEEWKERELERRAHEKATLLFSEWKLSEEKRIRELFEQWKKTELERSAHEKAELLFSEWKLREEERIREDAIRRSAATIIGKVGEHLAPLVIASNYGISPKDMRFIGTPIDFIAFKGLSDGVLEKIVFIEVKSGVTKSMTPREKMVKEAVESGKVDWLLIHLPSEMRKKEV